VCDNTEEVTAEAQRRGQGCSGFRDRRREELQICVSEGEGVVGNFRSDAVKDSNEESAIKGRAKGGGDGRQKLPILSIGV